MTFFSPDRLSVIKSKTNMKYLGKVLVGHKVSGRVMGDNYSVSPHALWMEAGVILEKTTPTRIETFHYRIKVIG